MVAQSAFDLLIKEAPVEPEKVHDSRLLSFAAGVGAGWAIGKAFGIAATPAAKARR